MDSRDNAPLPTPRHDSRSLTGAFIDRLVYYLPDHRYKTMVLGVDPELWHSRGMEICKRIDQGDPEEAIREELRAFFGPQAGDALLDSVKEILLPSFEGVR